MRGGYQRSAGNVLRKLSGCRKGGTHSLFVGPLPAARLITFSSCFHSFRPALPVSYLQAELAFEGEAACRAFLEPLGLAYTGPDNASIDCRLSLAQLSAF